MLEKVLQKVSLLMSRIGGGVLLAAAVLVAVEVTFRKTQIAAFSLGTELSSYALAVGATWSLAYVVFERGHVRIDILSQRLPDIPRAVANILAMASLAAVGLVLSAGAVDTFMTSFHLGAYANTTLATPLSIPQGLWAFGLAWFTLIAFYRTAGAAAGLIRRDLATVAGIAAPASSIAEADEIAADARSRFGP